MSTEKTTKEATVTVTFGGKSFIVLYVILSVLYIIPVSNPVQGMSWKWVVAPLAVYLALRALWKVIAFWIKRNVATPSCGAPTSTPRHVTHTAHWLLPRMTARVQHHMSK